MSGDVKPKAGADEEPKEPKQVLPTSLQIAGWTIPLVIAIVGLVKTVSDMAIAAQNELRGRTSAEIAFYDKQYDYITRLDGDKAITPPLLKASVEAMINRQRPDLRLGPLYDWALEVQRENALEQICRARVTALNIYSKDTYEQVATYRDGLIGELERATKPGERTALTPVVEWHNKCVDLTTREARRETPKVDETQPASAVAAPTSAGITVVAAAPGPAIGGGAEAAKQSSRPAARQGRLIDCNVTPPSGNDQKITVAEGGKADSGWDVDVFWCGSANPAAEAANFRAACVGYNNLLAETAVGARQETLGRQRLSRLPVATRARGGYNVVNKEVRYDAGNAVEQVMATALGDTAWPAPDTYSLRASRSNTQFYLSLFACPAG